jgi:hypothetical protein
MYQLNLTTADKIIKGDFKTMAEANNQGRHRGFAENYPAMSKEEADTEIKKLGVTQEDLDLDISHLDMNDLVDPKYLPAIAAKMLREGKMPNFNNPQVRDEFAGTVKQAFEKASAENNKPE